MGKTWSYVKITDKLKNDIIALLDEYQINGLGFDGCDDWQEQQTKEIRRIVTRLRKSKPVSR